MSLHYLPKGDKEAQATELPDWQKELIDFRLKSIDENPERILLIESLMAEIDSETF